MKNPKIQVMLAFFVFNAVICSQLYAQRKVTDPKHEYHYATKPIETNDVSIYFSDSHSQQEFTATKIRVVNKGNDYILYKTGETVFKYEFGEYHPSVGGLFRSSKMMVTPKSSDTRVLKITGGTNFHVENLTVTLNGFNRVPADGVVQEAPDFKLPVSVNDFEAGKFKCYLEEIKKETKVTEAIFKCVYQGNDVGIVDPSKIVLKLENGQEYANDNRRDRAELLLPGEEAKIKVIYHVPGKVADMQFANMVLVWKKAFQESKLEPISIEKVEFTLDPGMTEAKNK